MRVQDRAVEGAATAASLRAVASAFGVRAADVSLFSEATSRRKVLDVPGASETLLAELLAR